MSIEATKEEAAKLEAKLTELIGQLVSQRAVIGDFLLRTTMINAIRISRMKAKDKAEHDRVIREHIAFRDFCKVIGVKDKDMLKLTGGK